MVENQAFLDAKPQISAFVALDAPLLEKTDKINYAARCERTEKNAAGNEGRAVSLAAVRRRGLRGELLDFWCAGIRNPKLSERKDAGRRGGAGEMEARFGIRYEEALAMAFMERENLHRAVVAGG
ncbi:MAG: hypothetical protein ACLR4A_11765 [Christensenellales bacterium]